MVVGIVGFDLISVRKKDNMRKGEVLSGRNRREIKRVMVTYMLEWWRWTIRLIRSCQKNFSFLVYHNKISIGWSIYIFKLQRNLYIIFSCLCIYYLPQWLISSRLYNSNKITFHNRLFLYFFWISLLYLLLHIVLLFSWFFSILALT